MLIFNNNEELKALIVNGEIVINDSIQCDFNIDIEANINAYDINAWNINTYNINAFDINAYDINAYDINTYNINASNINYYAYCICYNSMECTSIIGRRSNSFHKCLDGELIIKPKENIMTIEEIEQKLGITNLKIKK